MSGTDPCLGCGFRSRDGEPKLEALRMDHLNYLRLAEGFDRTTRTLVLNLEVPPTDNHLHRSGQFSRYATAEYRAWIDLAGSKLRDCLGDWSPDTETWWEVSGWLFLPSVRADGQNFLKATLDLLSGAYVVPKDVRDASGQIVLRKDKLIKPGGLWNDDKRVRIAQWGPMVVRYPEPALVLQVKPSGAPLDWKEAAAALKRLERAQAQAGKLAEREAEQARKAAARAARTGVRKAPVRA